MPRCRIHGAEMRPYAGFNIAHDKQELICDLCEPVKSPCAVDDGRDGRRFGTESATDSWTFKSLSSATDRRGFPMVLVTPAGRALSITYSVPVQTLGGILDSELQRIGLEIDDNIMHYENSRTIYSNGKLSVSADSWHALLDEPRYLRRSVRGTR